MSKYSNSSEVCWNGKAADHCAQSLLSARATNAMPRAQERGGGGQGGLKVRLHLCHV